MPKFRGVTQEEYIKHFVQNPGYEGLMPAEHCGASYVYCLAHAKAYQGQIADAFHPLINHGIITPGNDEEELLRVSDNVDPSIWQIHDYVHGFSNLNRNLETRIVERTKELEAANQKLAQQKQHIEDVSTKISRYLPRQIYESIFAGEIDTDIASRRRNLTIFFSDICDFSRKTERLEPEALSEILNNYFSEMTEIARAYGATIDKFIGDAILIFFGDPNTEGPVKDGEACVAMAIDMQRRMGALRDSYDHLGLNEPLEMRIGINSGYCTVGNFGSFERIDYTIVGTPVNIAEAASRLHRGAHEVAQLTGGGLGQDGEPRGAGGEAAPLDALARPDRPLLDRHHQQALEAAGRRRAGYDHSLSKKHSCARRRSVRVRFSGAFAAQGHRGRGRCLSSSVRGRGGRRHGCSTTPEGQMRALKERLRRLDIDKLGDAEKDELLKSMSKLLGR